MAAVQQEFRFGRGGAREGAGRPKTRKGTFVAHTARPRHAKANPVHITLRVKAGLPALREFELFDTVEAAIHGGARKSDFRIVEYSVQRDHIHLIVEADDNLALSRGMQGLTIRIAKRINSRLHRTGAVFADHYHAHELSAPREVRNAIVYVLHNWRKHLPGANRGADPCSSARWFEFADLEPEESPPALPAAATWLLRVGWRRHGPISVRETPRAQFAFD
jgi:REP-associated tyrosine transposase